MTIQPPVPFLDLTRKINRHRDLIDAAIERVINRAQFILGVEVENFESLFATYLGIAHTIAVANGTDALEIALRATGITDSDTAAIAANAGNYASTAIRAVGATPTYMDVDYASRNITLEQVDRAIKSGARAIIATHLYGLAITEIEEISLHCRSAGVVLIEDCSQAHGAKVNNKMVGTFGDAGVFSFYPTKNLGAIGDAGAITTNDHAIAKKAMQLRSYGWANKYAVEIPGGRNSRADEIQAAVLSDLLPFLDSDNRRRREIASMYNSGINPSSLDLPTFSSTEYVAHHFVISSEHRAHFIEILGSHGISTSIHFPISDVDQGISQTSSGPHLPVTDRLTAQVFSIPCYPELTDHEVQRVIETLNSITEAR